MAQTKRQYLLADRAAALLNRRALKRFESARSAIVLSGFDELTILKRMKTLYAALDRDNREVFLDLAGMVYEQTAPHGKRKPDLIWLTAFLAAYDPVTKYIYANEVDRKRDYAAEAVIAAKNKEEEFQRALKYWANFTASYADLVTDAATVKAFQDAGVKKVRWRTERDEKVCGICHQRDGKAYPIDKVPPKPHNRCRCRLEPAK